ncbi:unnamed protein product [Parajaminaea phylloscopi]
MASATASSSKLPLNTSAVEHIHSALSPRIACLASPDVSRILEPNGFADLAECLRPFEDSVRGVTVRTSQLESKHCPHFPVRFDSLPAFSDKGDSSDQPHSALSRHQSRPEELLDDITALVTSEAKGWEERAPLPDPLDPDQLSRVRSKTIEELTPWFAYARDKLLLDRSVSRHETFGHPVAIILAVSNLSPDPLNAFASLYAATQAQNCELFSAHPYVDSNVLRYYVLLHDISQGADLSESIALLESVKKIYGLDCCILPINSAKAEGNDAAAIASTPSRLWEQACSSHRGLPKRSDDDADTSATSQVSDGRGQFAALLSQADVERLSAFVRELVAQSLIPWMERCVSHYNESIAASRKGLTGRLFGASRKLFGQSASRGGGAQERPNWNAAGAYYWASTMEAQTRRLADFAFILHDYKLAAATYDLGRKDYSVEKAHWYAAGATEMFGLSHLMMMIGSKASPVDVDSYLAASHSLYRSSHFDLATLVRILRSTLLYYQAYQALEFYRPAPAALLRTAEGPGGSELDAVGAMLLEQAAYAHLKESTRSPALRKWALCMAMAGQRYEACGVKRLCKRCFDGARNVYIRRGPPRKTFQDEDDTIAPETVGEQPSESAWAVIQTHVDSHLGKQAFNEGDAEQAVRFLLQTLRQVSPLPRSDLLSQDDAINAFGAVQAQYLSELIAAYDASRGADGEAAALEMPHPIVDSSGTYISVNRVSNASDKLDFAELENQFMASSSGGIAQGFAALGSQDQTVSVGESATLHLHLSNPLCTSISLTDIHVDFIDANTGTDVVAVPAASATVVQCQEAGTIELGPLESQQLRLSISSEHVGSYRAQRIAFKLNGRVLIQQLLDKRGRRLNDSVQQRRAQEPVYAPDETLIVKVIESAPSLAISTSSALPHHLGLGEEQEVAVTFTNAGKAPMRGLRCLLSNLEAAQFVVSEAGPSVSGPTTQVSNALQRPQPLDLLGQEEFLAPGASIIRLLRLRGTALGAEQYKALFIYSDSLGQLGKATWQHTVQVDPSVDVAVDVNPCLHGFAYTLAITAVNLTDTENVEISAINFVSPRWENDETVLVSSLPRIQGSTFTSLPVGQPRTAFAGVKEGAMGTNDPSRMLDYTSDQLRAQLRGRDIRRTDIPGSVDLIVSKSDSTDLSPAQLDPLLLASRQRWRHRSLEAAFPSVSEQDRRRIFTLYQPEDLDVVVQWRTRDDSGTSRHGRVFIFGLSLGPGQNRILPVLKEAELASDRTMYEETALQKAALLSALKNSALAVEEDPIVVDIDLSPDLDSSAELIPVTFRVRNMSTSRYAACIIDLDSAVDPDAFWQGASGGATKAAWHGRLTLRAPSVAPKETVELRAQAIRPAHTSVNAATSTAAATSQSSNPNGVRAGAPELPPKGYTLADWSIKVDVLETPSVAVDAAQPVVLAHFNSGRLSSGRFIPA